MTPRDYLDPYIEDWFGDEVCDPDARLGAFLTLIPGNLPDDYAELLRRLPATAGLRANRIEAIETPRPREPGVFEFVGPNFGIDLLFGLQPNHDNVFEVWDILKPRLPQGLVPIGYCGPPNAVCLDVSPTRNGRVYHWFHLGDPGPNDADGRPGWGNTFLLADSFTDLCRRLRPFEG